MLETRPKSAARPCDLQHLVFFCHHGHENLHQLTKDHFKILTDDDGRRYLAQTIDEMDKDHRADDPNNTNEGQMYATGTQRILLQKKHSSKCKNVNNRQILILLF